ncbi:Bor/Iss family lipoprotein [Sediminitomix flava]|uniref:Bor protein n=1 Tax=Sediminitomix flava TaxID=379075 RepID=A0A315Z8F2_SEDFL|nr:hypothetical protein [Sediminitomix flava]PWJ41845.1 hypothetical protein BC781_10395 [Sediminitomix flava]
MKQFFVKLSAVLLAVTLFASCSINEHMVGKGAQNGVSVSKKQWYFLSTGLARLNDVDTRDMAGDATDYTIETKAGFVDLLIGAVTFNLVGARTVTVTK